MEELKKTHEKYQKTIRKRLSQFKANWGSERKVFAELVFCLLTPQSKAVQCDKAVKKLLATDIAGWKREWVEGILRGNARFYRQKAKNIMLARKKFFKNGEIKIKGTLRRENIERDKLKTREWLVKNVRGIGLKEASHFLRNIGFYENIAIIDRHILKNMKRYGLISTMPKTVTKKRYYELENKLNEFSRKVSIPMEELDLLFWANETGFVFK